MGKKNWIEKEVQASDQAEKLTVRIWDNLIVIRDTEILPEGREALLGEVSLYREEWERINEVIKEVRNKNE